MSSRSSSRWDDDGRSRYHHQEDAHYRPYDDRHRDPRRTHTSSQYSSSRQDPHYTDNSYHQPDYYDKQRYPSRDDSRSMNTSHTVYNQPHYSSASYNPYASLPNPHSLPPQPHSGYGMLPQYAHINPQFVYGNLNFGYMMPTYAPPPPFPHASRPLSASDSSVHVRRDIPGVRLLPSGIYTELPEEIPSVYRAAGVLVYAIDDGRVKVLLGCEDRSKKRSGRRGEDLSAVWLHFGGKKEDYETQPHETALRELDEETVGIFEKDMASISQRLQDKNCSKLWFPSGKYVLYFLKVDYDFSLVERFAAAKEAIKEGDPKKESDQFKLKWINWTTVADTTRNRRDFDFYFSEDPRDAPPQHLASFFGEMMSARGVSSFFHGVMDAELRSTK